MGKFLKADNFLNLMGIFLIFGFVIRLVADYYKYQNIVNDIPFYGYIIGRSVEFLLPSIVCFIAAAYVKKKNLLK